MKAWDLIINSGNNITADRDVLEGDITSKQDQAREIRKKVIATVSDIKNDLQEHKYKHR